MGDMIEMTTWPSHQNVFYRISAGGLMFEVKGAARAAVGLARKPGTLCDIWVVIGHEQRTWIKNEEGTGKVVRTPNILNNGEYRRFWLSWRGGLIQFGRFNESSPIVSHASGTEWPYITFSAGGGGIIETNPIHWRFELPPVLEKPQLKPVTNGELAWVSADNHFPDGALIGGYEKETLYIIRASHRGSLTPGKFVPSQRTGFISWGGQSHNKHEYEVLCGFDCTWVPTYDDRIPVGAVEGGYSEGPHMEKLYVGRALYCGNIIPGKVQPSHKVCYIPYDGREIAQKKFEILVSPVLNARCANRLFTEHIDVESPPDSDNDAEFEEYPDEDFNEEDN